MAMDLARIRKELTEKFSGNLYKCRMKQGHSQQKLADLIGVTDKQISNFETARSLPSLPTLYGICRLYDVSPNDMLGYDGRPDSELNSD
ncbi:hypothetical protein CMI48_00065 [Candidatus Pacearchaeota archaeon]|nr:hypothetical protein [Candidatus Pacearchaeota archaeon]